jgi:hypothetical protein
VVHSSPLSSRFYIYYKELNEKHYNIVLGAAALWDTDIFNEIWNSIVFHATGFAPVWGTPVGTGNTSLLLLVRYDIEISFMFAILGLAGCLALPQNKKVKIFGINNRVFYAVLFTTVAVLIEFFLN